MYTIDMSKHDDKWWNNTIYKYIWTANGEWFDISIVMPYCSMWVRPFLSIKAPCRSTWTLAHQLTTKPLVCVSIKSFKRSSSLKTGDEFSVIAKCGTFGSTFSNTFSVGYNINQLRKQEFMFFTLTLVYKQCSRFCNGKKNELSS